MEWMRSKNEILIALVILSITTTQVLTQNCAVPAKCKNGGTCRVVNEKDTCECTEGYFDVVCESSASTLVVVLGDARVEDWMTALVSFKVHNVSLLSQSDTEYHYKAVFHKVISNDDRQGIKVALSSELVDRIIDFDECSQKESLCYGGNEVCKNTDGSFECTCGDGYKISNGACVKDVDNTKTTIYIWAIIVSVLVLWMIGLVVFINCRKAKRGKKQERIMRERQEKEKERELSPTNLQTLQVATLPRPRGGSPASSVFAESFAPGSQAMSDAYLFPGPARNNPSRMSAPPELMLRGSVADSYSGEDAEAFASYPGNRYAHSLGGIDELDGYDRYPYPAQVNPAYTGSMPRLEFADPSQLPAYYADDWDYAYEEDRGY